jgi:hypothetical protein
VPGTLEFVQNDVWPTAMAWRYIAKVNTPAILQILIHHL